MNLKIKFRESFRPFAPSVLAEHLSDWFQLDRDSPYMLLVADVAKGVQKESEVENSAVGLGKLCLCRSEIPAVTHVDFSARIQTVHCETNPRYHTLINTFYKKTGCPVIVNTSFNVRGEPIVCTPEEAYSCFMLTEMDILVLENFVLLKDAQNILTLERNYNNEFQLD
jgi:carbamoyltransferase